MTFQWLHSEFPYIWGKFDFLFYQCRNERKMSIKCSAIMTVEVYSVHNMNLLCRSILYCALKPACSCSKIRGTSGTPTPTPSWVTVRGNSSIPAAPPRMADRSSSAAAAAAALRRIFYSRGTHSVSGRTGHAAAVRHLPRILSRYEQPKQLTWDEGTPQGADPSPPPLSPWRQVEIIWTSKLPPIDEWYSQTISIKGQAAHRHCIGKKSHPKQS